MTVKDPSGSSLTTQARRMVVSLEALLRLLTPSPSPDAADISLRDARAFAVLMHDSPMSMTKFAHALGVPLSTATHTVNRLVRKDIVSRSHSDRDRRLITVQLSERGSRYATAFLARRLELAREMLALLSPGERAIFLEIAGKLTGVGN